MHRRFGRKSLEKKTNSITAEKLYISVRVLGAILSYHCIVAILLSFRRSCRVESAATVFGSFSRFRPNHLLRKCTVYLVPIRRRGRTKNAICDCPVLGSVTRVHITIILSPSFSNDNRKLLLARHTHKRLRSRESSLPVFNGFRCCLTIA